MRLSLLMASLAVALAVAATGVSLAEETRERIALTPREREQVRAGMRTYLEHIQGIVDGLTKHDFNAVARSAAKSGMSAIKDVPAALALRLPPQFTLMSVDTHEKFDLLAKEAREKRTNLAVQRALGDLLGNCTACHAMFRF